MMTGFLKRNVRVGAVLITALSLPALLFPLHHFHPDSRKHVLPGQLNVIGHQAHFHSEALEAYAHFFNAHPSDPALDAPLHQSHSASGHEKDDVESYTFQKDIIPAKNAFVLKYFLISVPMQILQPLLSRPGDFEFAKFIPLNIFGPPSSRSPPAFLI